MKDLNRARIPNGFSLIELMIALVLGLIITAGVIEVFLSNKQTYRLTEAHSRLQDNARFALEVLSKDIRSAGYSGCRTIDNMNVNTIANAPVPTSMDTNSILTGHEAMTSSTWTPILDASVALGDVIGGTDVVTLQRAGTCGGNLVGNTTTANANIKISYPNSCNINAGDVLMIADCEDAHIFRATSAPSPPGSDEQTIAHAINGNQANFFCTYYDPAPSSGACATGTDKLYGYDAEIYTFTALTYFIRAGANGDNALWQYNHNKSASSSNPTELMEGIEDMQVEYGIDDNGDDILDRTETANIIDAAGDWDKVISTRINFLTQTLDENLTTTDQAINFNGNTIPGTDGRIRRVFSSTIGVRNRVQ